VGDKVVFAPYAASKVGVYDVSTGTLDVSVDVTVGHTTPCANTVNACSHAAYSGAAAAGGKVYFAPYFVDDVGVYNVATGTFTTITTGLGSNYHYLGAAAVGSSIVFTPWADDVVGVVDSDTDTFSSTVSTAPTTMAYKFAGAAAVGSVVVFAPYDAPSVGTCTLPDSPPALPPPVPSAPPSPPVTPPTNPPLATLVTADEAKPLCAGPTELCFLDTICTTPWLDLLGGLGCNAGGKGQQYRFCGFGPFVACPGPPKWIVGLTSIVTGAVETFDAPAYRATLRNVLPTLANDDVLIALNVTSASVRVKAGIVLRTVQDAGATAAALAAMDAASLSTALGVTVTTVEQVSAVMAFAFAAASPPPPASVVIQPGGSVVVKAGGTLSIG